MFGQNTITSSWANPQQNPPQQQGTGAFGQPTAFGSTAPGFGSSTGAFGQPQQQPQANPMFGNLGASTSNTGGGGFGAFGGASNQASTSTNPLFGGAKPATGFGAFGGGGTFGSTGTGTFGQPNTGGTGGFGQTSNPTTGGAFGNTGNSIFGGNKGTTAFGSAPTNNAINPVTTGSSNPPYTVYQEKDANAPSVTLQYQSISCMPAYAGTSFEELRLQDYQQGRKTAATGSFGQPSGFGNTQTGGSIFGQPQNQQSTSIFGAPKAPAGFGTFGATNTNTTNPGTGAFGTGGAFGQPQQPQPQQTFGAFGQPPQPQQPQQASSIFGGNTGGGAFGNTGTTGLGTFGAPTGGAFGQNANQQQQPQAGSSIFGQQPAPSTTAGFGSFGNTANKPSIFGQASQPAGQTQSLFSGGGSSIFGQQNQPQGQQQQPQQPSIFGNTGGTGLFGNTQQQQNPQQPAAGTSLFTNPQNTGTSTGNSLFGGGGGGSLFGNNNNQQAQQQQTQQPTTTGFGNGGLFGNANKPAGTGGGLFASGFGQTQPANTQQPGLFSNSLNQPNNQQQSNLGGSLFAKAPGLGTSTSTGNGLFGTQFGGSMNSMNGSTSVPGAQGTLIASISQPISTNLPIFSMLPPGPRAVDLEQSTKKKPGFFVDVPTRSPVPRVQLGYTPASSKLRGFGSSTSSNALGSSMFSNSTALTMSRSQTPKNAIDAIFGTSSSPSLGSGQRKSVKKLILDKKVEPTELFIKSGGSPIRGKITFSPALSVAAREKEAAAAAASAVAVTAVLPSTQPAKSPTPTPQPHRTPKKFTASASGAQPDEDGDLQEGDYYVKPNLDTLKTAGFDQLSSFQDLVVGRVGYGEIHFLDPVDLTGLLKLGALLGEVIRFDDKECSVYPDSDDADKPPPGSGLNVRAKISLKRCWAIDKAHRDPIKDEKHPSAVKHLKKLKNMKDTHFESFDISDGTWTFTVDHF